MLTINVASWSNKRFQKELAWVADLVLLYNLNPSHSSVRIPCKECRSPNVGQATVAARAEIARFALFKAYAMCTFYLSWRNVQYHGCHTADQRWNRQTKRQTDERRQSKQTGRRKKSFFHYIFVFVPKSTECYWDVNLILCIYIVI